MPDLHSLSEAWNSPPTRHAMFVHTPIVLAMVGAVLALLAAILTKNKTCRALAIGCQVALIIAAYLTLNTGEAAENAITEALTQDVSDLIHEHEEMADKVWLFGAGVLALLVLAAITKNVTSIVFGWLAVIGAIFTIGWVGGTANLGGELVYKHGVGTRRPVTAPNAPSPPVTPRTAASQPATMHASGGAGAGDAETIKVAFFRDEVFPILSSTCFRCHNPTRAAAGKSGSLDQTSRETLLKGGKSGPAVVPGKPEDSVLLHRVRGDDPEEELMPPNGRLSEEEVAAIERWIRDGAVWAEPESGG